MNVIYTDSLYRSQCHLAGCWFRSWMWKIFSLRKALLMVPWHMHRTRWKNQYATKHVWSGNFWQQRSSLTNPVHELVLNVLAQLHWPCDFEQTFIFYIPNGSFKYLSSMYHCPMMIFTLYVHRDNRWLWQSNWLHSTKKSTSHQCTLAGQTPQVRNVCLLHIYMFPTSKYLVSLSKPLHWFISPQRWDYRCQIFMPKWRINSVLKHRVLTQWCGLPYQMLPANSPVASSSKVNNLYKVFHFYYTVYCALVVGTGSVEQPGLHGIPTDTGKG